MAFCALLMTSIDLFSLEEIELLVDLAVGVGAADADGACWAARLGILAVIWRRRVDGV